MGQLFDGMMEWQKDDERVEERMKYLGALLALVGPIMAILAISIWVTVLPYEHEEIPVFWIILGVFIAIQGIITYLKPSNSFSIECLGNVTSKSLPLRNILIGLTNIICATTGIITMSILGPCWWSPWNILGLILSILLLCYGVAPSRLIPGP